ncbi:ATP-dependent Clp protease proteolytic subunit [Streptomyces tricolor]|nr:ATP-dependent Clp protease proteolytic subunit [Streptomyces tricolor]
MSRPSAPPCPARVHRARGERRAHARPVREAFEDRIVFLGTPVDHAAAQDVTAQLMYSGTRGPGPGHHVGTINSPGGSFDAMATVYDTMQYVSCDVATYRLGQAAARPRCLLAAGAGQAVHPAGCPAW